jgi:hypothetical protein
MCTLGVIQDGDAILRQVARPFDLQANAEDARGCRTPRRRRTDHPGPRVREGHRNRGPQIGIDRAATIVCSMTAH